MLEIIVDATEDEKSFTRVFFKCGSTFGVLVSTRTVAWS